MEEKFIIKRATKDDLISVANLFNEEVASEKFYKPLDAEIFKWKFLGLKNFDLNGVILAFVQNELVGYVICTIRRENEGVINAFLVKHDYRNQGIGKKLLEEAEFFYKMKKITDILVYGYLPIGYPWWIPNTKRHYHPCAPGVPVGSDLYEFLLHEKYEIKTYNDAFHLDLKKYQISPEIAQIVEKNRKDGFDIEFYDKYRHRHLEEFCDEINHPSFKKVIMDNLKLPKPYPFMIVSHNNEVKGWTGALYSEASGRGHIDGIQLHDDTKGRGLGKALFCIYCNELKKIRAKYMTFYTGRDNFARNIYSGAGFEIVQSFAILEKKIK